MPLYHIKGEGQGAGRGVKYADARAAVAKIEVGQIMMPPTHPLIDDLVRCAAHFQHLAKGRKGLGSEGLQDQLTGHGSMPFSRRCAMRST